MCRDTELQAGRSRVRLPMASLKLFISIIFPVSLLWSTQSLTDSECQGYFLRVKAAVA